MIQSILFLALTAIIIGLIIINLKLSLQLRSMRKRNQIQYIVDDKRLNQALGDPYSNAEED